MHTRTGRCTFHLGHCVSVQRKVMFNVNGQGHNEDLRSKSDVKVEVKVVRAGDPEQ